MAAYTCQFAQDGEPAYFEKHFLCFVYTKPYTLGRRHCTDGDDAPGCVYRAYDFDMMMRLKVFPIHFRNTRAGCWEVMVACNMVFHEDQKDPDPIWAMRQANSLPLS